MIEAHPSPDHFRQQHGYHPLSPTLEPTSSTSDCSVLASMDLGHSWNDSHTPAAPVFTPAPKPSNSRRARCDTTPDEMPTQGRAARELSDRIPRPHLRDFIEGVRGPTTGIVAPENSPVRSPRFDRRGSLWELPRRDQDVARLQGRDLDVPRGAGATSASQLLLTPAATASAPASHGVVVRHPTPSGGSSGVSRLPISSSSQGRIGFLDPPGGPHCDASISAEQMSAESNDHGAGFVVRSQAPQHRGSFEGLVAQRGYYSSKSPFEASYPARPASDASRDKKSRNSAFPNPSISQTHGRTSFPTTKKEFRAPPTSQGDSNPHKTTSRPPEPPTFGHEVPDTRQVSSKSSASTSLQSGQENVKAHRSTISSREANLKKQIISGAKTRSGLSTPSMPTSGMTQTGNAKTLTHAPWSNDKAECISSKSDAQSLLPPLNPQAAHSSAMFAAFNSVSAKGKIPVRAPAPVRDNGMSPQSVMEWITNYLPLAIEENPAIASNVRKLADYVQGLPKRQPLYSDSYERLTELSRPVAIRCLETWARSSRYPRGVIFDRLKAALIQGKEPDIQESTAVFPKCWKLSKDGSRWMEIGEEHDDGLAVLKGSSSSTTLTPQSSIVTGKRRREEEPSGVRPAYVASRKKIRTEDGHNDFDDVELENRFIGFFDYEFDADFSDSDGTSSDNVFLSNSSLHDLLSIPYDETEDDLTFSLSRFEQSGIVDYMFNLVHQACVRFIVRNQTNISYPEVVEFVIDAKRRDPDSHPTADLLGWDTKMLLEFIMAKVHHFAPGGDSRANCFLGPERHQPRRVLERFLQCRRNRAMDVWNRRRGTYADIDVYEVLGAAYYTVHLLGGDCAPILMVMKRFEEIKMDMAMGRSSIDPAVEDFYM
ncbi:hypothetical protein BC938DRAFT_480565 [Jimgerdemannia flammicorona]|uniref:Uncharacterized protein n=1 Tax=Jimgerdemannia flammicorona TaxID=994334 RepID=A0A433QI88_9FUNG|nr:hypothetical protein BC938DRAFT_480565 [Jimgerdemannia flammicorona]